LEINFAERFGGIFADRMRCSVACFFSLWEKGIVMKGFMQKVKGVVLSPMMLVMALAAVAMFVGSVDVLAQDPQPATIEFEPIVNYGDLFGSIRIALGPILVGAIGLGLSIWGALYIFRLVKSASR
jgi:hypothetical protein